jgi:hypothetical protein
MGATGGIGGGVQYAANNQVICTPNKFVSHLK